MKLNNLPSEFQEALPILQKLKDTGYEAYFVGGSVRDAILGRPIHDVDIATSAYPEETKTVFSRTVDIGIEHGTVLVLQDNHEYEVTTFRTEDVYVDYRRPSQVSFVRSLTEDLKRRDFTVNAFALGENGEVVDKFNGLADLDHHILRAVGLASERFNEDALRIMRGFRFAASLDFAIEAETFTAMKETAHLLEKISIERIFIEFDKLLMAKHWRKGLSYLIESAAYEHLPGFAGKKTQLKNLLACLDENFVFQTSEQAWAFLLFTLGAKDDAAFLRQWKTSNDFQKAVRNLLAVYRYRIAQEADAMLVYRYGKETVLLAEGLRQAQNLPVDWTNIETIDATLPIHTKHEIVVNGAFLIKEMGLQPGPQLGELLNRLERRIVAGLLANNKEEISHFIVSERVDDSTSF